MSVCVLVGDSVLVLIESGRFVLSAFYVTQSKPDKKGEETFTVERRMERRKGFERFLGTHDNNDW